MRVIAIINQKGGCGKTTTAINLAGCLAANKRRVLVIDLDPQGHASLGLNLRPEEVTRGMTEVLTQGTLIDDVIVEGAAPNLDLAPANITLSAVEQLLADASHKERKLSGAIDHMRRPYDYVIIDSPPNLGILTFNALRASEMAIVPVDMGFFSLHGLTKLLEITEVLGRHTGHHVQLRALTTMVNLRTRFTQEVLDEVKRYFRGKVFGTPIRNNVRLREASSHGIPITEYEAKSIGAQDYQSLTLELMAMEAAVESSTQSQKESVEAMTSSIPHFGAHPQPGPRELGKS
jgi:chromosome partitioning protein